ncbi:MAG TPA: hypothetical protein VMW49_04650 [Candidatus Dormibacteraeota bacterium]|nr:hypothetical protein [Candidatus Dormibacteraeota bacterium]
MSELAAEEEYRLEIADLRRKVSRLKAEHGEAHLIEEFEAELRILDALFQAATVTLAAVERDPMLADQLRQQGFPRADFREVYAFVYDAALELELADRPLAAVIRATDFTAGLRAPA